MTTTAARELVRSALELPSLLETINDDDDLLSAGVNSGELIMVAMRCEQRLGRPLTEAELSRLHSITAVAAILGGSDGPA
jgi:hypothetical protein